MPNEPTWEDTTEPVPTWDETVPVEPVPIAQPAPQAPIIPFSGMQSESLEARDFLRTSPDQLRGMGDKPIVPIPKVPQQQGALAQAGAGLVNVATGLIEGIETPQMIAALPIFPARLSQLIFGGAALKGAYEEGKQAFAPDRTIQQRIESGGRGLVDLIFGGTLLRGATRGLTPFTDSVARPEPVPEVRQAPAVTEQPKQGGEIGATQERQIQESVPAEHPRDGEIGTSSETSSSSGVQPAAEVQGQTEVAKPEGTGEIVQRIEEPGVGRAEVTKPHGIYTTPAEHPSPHADLGGKKFLWRLNPEAKVLDVTGAEAPPMRRMATASSPGVAAAKKLLPPEIGNLIRPNMGKTEAIEIAKARFPNVDWNRYYDAQEVMEGLGGMEAKKAGYDIIKGNDPEMPEFSERILLTKNAGTPIAESEATAAPVTQIPTTASEAAKPTETAPVPAEPVAVEQQFPTLSSTKNVTTDLQRAARNIEPVEKAVIQSRSATWDEAARTDNADPLAKNRLIDEFESNPRAAKPIENDLILRRLIEVEKEHEAAVHEVNRTKSPEAQSRLDSARDELQRVYNVARATGTEAGLSLNARKAMADRDLNLAWMEAQVRAAGKSKPLTTKTLGEVKDVHDQLKSTQGRIFDNEKRLAAYKKRVATQTSKLAGKIESGDLAPVTRERLKLDDEAFGLQQEYQALRNKFNQLVEREKLKSKNFYERALNTFVALERSMKLTGITTLGKIAGAAVTRTAQSIAENVVGGVLGKLPGLSKIAEKAPREGGLSLAAETAGLRAFGKGIKEIPGVVTGKISTYETRIPTSKILGTPGRLHGALKRPAWRSEYDRSIKLYEQEASRLGKDPDNPQVRQSIREGAKANADRAIFQNDNVVSSSWNVLLRALESSKKYPNAGFLLSRIGRFLLPIVRVPTNIALETGTMLTGSLTGTGKLIGVMSRGLKNIESGEAELIMRHYKKGAVGAGLFLTGYFNPDSFGGFYEPRGDRQPGDLAVGEAQVMGITIPWWLLHGPPFLVMQAGATARKLMDKEKGAAASGHAVIRGIAEEIPFIKETTAIDSMLGETHEASKAIGDLARSTVVPQAVQNVARWTTEKDSYGHPVLRKPENLLDYIKLGIPGLREQVPLKPEKQSENYIQ